MTSWTVVVPIRDPRTGKSRLGLSAGVAAGVALDTLAAVRAAARVGRVIVVTDDAGWIGSVEVADQVVLQREPGLTAAVLEGVAAAGEEASVAVLLGDLPSLLPTDLDAALQRAEAHPLGFVPDAEGTGTTLVTARQASAHRPAFGNGSAMRHADAGYADLGIPAGSTLRHDVDTLEDLEAAEKRGVGALTRAARRR